MMIPERSFSSEDYRFGFNNQEKADAISGTGNNLDFKFRCYDSRLGRFLSIDPLRKIYPWLSSYQFAGNTPIACVDIEGLEMYFAADGSFLGQSKNGGNEIKIATNYRVYAVVNNVPHYEITHSVGIAESKNLIAAGKIYKTIYEREIKGKPLATKTPPDIQAASLDEKVAGATAQDTKKVTINKSIVTDYYDATNVLFHEQQHVDGLNSSGFDHFEILIRARKHESFEAQTDFMKKFNANQGIEYLHEQESYIRQVYKEQGGKKNSDLRSMFDKYRQNVVEYNKLFNEQLNEPYQYRGLEQILGGGYNGRLDFGIIRRRKGNN